jgi:hypothetical protein
MIVKNVSQSTILRAAAAVHVGTSPLTFVTGRGETYRFTLTPIGDAYRRRDHRGKRRLYAVCFHGYFAFFRALFALEPTAKIATGRAKYTSIQELEAGAEAVGERNIGSQAAPCAYKLACTCHEYNIGGVLPIWGEDGEPTYNARSIAHVIDTDHQRALDPLWGAIGAAHYTADGSH